MRRIGRGWLLIVGYAVSTVAPLHAQSPLTLERALREARQANVALPVARFDTAIAGTRIRQAMGRLWPSLEIGGDAHGGAPSRFASGDARLVLIGRVPLYDGGRLRSEVRAARASGHVAASGYRIAQRDLDFEVRLRFSGHVEIERELAFRRSGIERLIRYIGVIETRLKSGEGLTGDLLRARVALNQQTAALAETERRIAESALAFNELLGREPSEPVHLAPSAPPGEPLAAASKSWVAAPDIQRANAVRQVAKERIGVTRAGRRPQLELEINGGSQPVLGSSFAAALNNGRGSGGEFTLLMRLPVLDKGVYRASLERARLSYEQAEQALVAVRRGARLAWNRARVDLEASFREVQIRRRNVPLARDAYLHAESLYWGGAATSLEVLDAYRAWIDANQQDAEATFRYRVAEAGLRRWGLP